MKQPIWILLDSQGVGGIESHVINLAQGLIENGCPAKIVFLQQYGDHPLAPVIKALGIPFAFLPGGFKALLTALDERPRLLHTHGYKAGILGRIAAKIKTVPVVSTYHAGEPGQGKVRLYDTVDRWTAFLAPAIAVSDAIAQRIPVSSTQFKNFVSVPDEDIKTSSDAIGFVGRFSFEKGAERFLCIRQPMRQPTVYCVWRRAHVSAATITIPRSGNVYGCGAQYDPTLVSFGCVVYAFATRRFANGSTRGYGKRHPRHCQ